MTVHELITWAAAELERSGVPAARWDAEVLLGAALDRPALSLPMFATESVSAPVAAAFRAMVARRSTREPLQYILGHQEFMGLDFRVNPAVLVPRPDTEHLAEAALASLAETECCFTSGEPLSALDLCTGSGALAVTLAVRRPDLRLIATDLSAEALAVARDNAVRNGVVDRVDFRQGDLFAAVPAELAGRIALLVSNPPYIPTATLAGLQAEVRREPRMALDGGPDGLLFYRRIIAQAPHWLRPGGIVALEIGFDQGETVLALLAADPSFRGCALRKDYAGNDRVVLTRTRGDCM